MVKLKKNFPEATSELEPIATETAVCEGNIRTTLEQIKNYNGVIGYILRNTTSAAIDLNDPTKLIDYATLSSSTFDASEQLSELFDLGKIKDTIIEGKHVKTLHLSVGENNVSIFMEKNTDIKEILKKMQLP